MFSERQDKVKLSEQSEKMSLLIRKSMNWLLHSEIRIKSGENRGAIYGWKNISPPSYPFIYNEITGYAMTFFSWVYKELRDPEALFAAEYAAEWVNNNFHSGLMVAGKLVEGRFRMKGDLENQNLLL